MTETIDGEKVAKRVGFTTDIAILKSPTLAMRGPGKYDPYAFEDKEDENEGSGGIMSKVRYRLKLSLYYKVPYSRSLFHAAASPL